MNPVGAQPPRLLVVEDDDDIRGAVSELLTDEGYGVDAFVTAEEGLCALKARPYRVVITDEMLPGHYGSWMLARAREEGRLETTGVIVLSALHVTVAHPSHVHLLKPIDINELLAAVADCIARASGAERTSGSLKASGSSR